MFEAFEKYASERTQLTREEFSLIRSLSTERKIAKREFILREGEIAAYTNFVTRGLLRLFRIDHKGDEHIMKFAHENRWINDRESYLTGRPAVANIEAIEDSQIITWKKENFDALLKEIPAFKQMMKNLSAKNQIAIQNRVFSTISLSAEEKYLQFITQYPSTFNRVPLHMVAAYLGVTRETLSRIRKHA